MITLRLLGLEFFASKVKNKLCASKILPGTCKIIRVPNKPLSNQNKSIKNKTARTFTYQNMSRV